MDSKRDEEDDSAPRLQYRLVSEEFTVGFVSVMSLIGLGIPLLSIWYRNLSGDRLLLSSLAGLLGILVVGIAVWKLLEVVQRARRKENHPHERERFRFPYQQPINHPDEVGTMSQKRLTKLAGFVAAMGLLLLSYEVAIVFREMTGTLPTGLQNSPFLMVAIPFSLALLLVVVLIGGALLHTETLR